MAVMSTMVMTVVMVVMSTMMIVMHVVVAMVTVPVPMVPMMVTMVAMGMMTVVSVAMPGMLLSHAQTRPANQKSSSKGQYCHYSTKHLSAPLCLQKAHSTREKLFVLEIFFEKLMREAPSREGRSKKWRFCLFFEALLAVGESVFRPPIRQMKIRTGISRSDFGAGIRPAQATRSAPSWAPSSALPE